MIDRFSMESPDGRARLEIDPQRGGRMSSLVIDDHDLLVAPTDDPLTWGAYPMVPFAGRIRSGRLDFDGAVHELPVTLGTHAIHGHGFTSAWDRIGDTSIGLVFDRPWPFAGTVTQDFALSDQRLDVSMTVTAVERQPVSMGWHPWFRRNIGRSEDAALEFTAVSMYERDVEGIPSGVLVDPPPGPWDDCFTGLTAAPVIRWGSFELALSSSADHWVIYDQPAHAFCVEPQTGPPNESNTSPRVLDPGDTHTITFTLEW